MRSRNVAYLGMVLLASGCLGPGGLGLNSSDAPPDASTADPVHSLARIPDLSRDQVRQHLGPPALSSTFWQFDLFRSDVGHDHSTFLTWFGIPVAPLATGSAKEHSRYTLVAYDDPVSGASLQTGIVLNPTWRSSPLAADYAKLYLRAGEVLFVVDKDWNRGVNLLASPVARDEYLARVRGTTDCIAVLGCGYRGCPDRIGVDGAHPRKLPLRGLLGYLRHLGSDTQHTLFKGMNLFSTGPWIEMLNAMRLRKGDHELVFSAASLEGTGRLTLKCDSGGVLYVLVNPSASDHAFIRWDVETTPAMPPSFSDRPLLLVNDGHWYAEQEPQE